MNKVAITFIWSLLFIGFAASAQVEDKGRDGVLYYQGKLGNKEPLEFNLRINKKEVIGSYILKNQSKFYTYKGRLNQEQTAIGIVIYDENQDYVATAEAKLVSLEDDFAKEIHGVWKSADGFKVLKLDLKKVAELADLPALLPCSSEDRLGVERPLQGE